MSACTAWDCSKGQDSLQAAMHSAMRRTAGCNEDCRKGQGSLQEAMHSAMKRTSGMR